jgi:FAD/FMN-containing dehydrogenase
MNRRHFAKSSLAAALAVSLAPRTSLSAILSPTMAVDADIDAVAGDGASITLKRAAVQELGDSLRGDLLLPGHPAYEDARRVINADINRHPALIVQCKGTADVKNAVDFARESNLLVAVKCGGHSHSGKSTCDGGMMIDLSKLRSVRVDPNARIAQVSGGSLLADMDHDTMAFGLVTTAGTVSHTGVGGLTLGGGYGRLARRFGLSLDNIRGVEIITADGEFRQANAAENPDLFWGVRGGGGNFGVVTSFEFGLHPMDRQVIGGTIAFPLSQAKDVLRFYADYAMEAPDELSLDLAMANDATQGSSVVFLICYSGPHDKAEPILDTLRSAGKPVFDDVKAVDYVALQKSGDISDPRGIGSYTKSGFSAELSTRFIDAILAGFEPHPERSTTFYFQHDGGAINRIAPDATAFPHREINLTPLVSAAWPADADRAEHVAWARAYWATIEPFTQGFYTNDLIDESQEQVNRNYFGNYDRLVALKNRYDPTNLFRLNANILPTV